MSEEMVIPFEDVNFDEEIDEEEQEVKKVYDFKCKPCWEYQSIEFTFTGTEDDLPEMFTLYFKILEQLKKDSPLQSTNGRQLPKYPATDAQKAIMDKYSIKYDKFTSKQKAAELIEESKRKAER